MTESKFSFRITDPALPSGQILASDLARLVEGLQVVAQRITRDLAGASARGRTPQQRSDASQIMITGLASGYTVLDLPGATDAQISERFEAVISDLNSEVWDVPTESVLREVVVSGILNRVDSRTNTFRITDMECVKFSGHLVGDFCYAAVATWWNSVSASNGVR